MLFHGNGSRNLKNLYLKHCNKQPSKLNAENVEIIVILSSWLKLAVNIDVVKKTNQFFFQIHFYVRVEF